MNKKWIFTMAGVCMLLGAMLRPVSANTETAKTTILATTFPVYQILRNVIQDHGGVTAGLLLPSQLGCPHDYALTPQDMQKLAKADILVINGLGMEEFMGAPVKKANPGIQIIDTSAGIQNTLDYFGECDHSHDHGDGHDHHHHGVNPHLFASPRMTALLAQNLAKDLSRAVPGGSALFLKNARDYAGAMNRLADHMAALGKRLKNKRIVQPHGVFEYLARDMGLNIVAVMLAHGQAPSAAGMRHLAKTIKQSGAGAIFTEPQYPEKIGKTLARETGIPAAVLDPAATGPENAPLSYYETVMRNNMNILESTLGVW